MAVDKQAIEKHVFGILQAIGENPNRQGLKDTPKRVARMFEEVFDGIKYSNDDIAKMYDKTFDEEDFIESSDNDIVLVKDIEVFSHCEHHLTLMYNMNIAVAYIPNGKVIGLSKICRIADMVSRRLQLQERIGSDIAYILQKIVDTQDVAVVIEAEHGCMTSRGIKKPGAKTVTITSRGKFKNNEKYLDRLMKMI
ncbi:GTP cyclohydrolase 1 [Vallitalea longa]|uniref:GTP cyclohydrolase 1 n=1 Tax=Vallitalea longa TaxID=2936439 RepID=A0A9W5YA28_9FIRM|nr:GTP cyclohydrolase I FolE [Vallitalea longa]GKX28835.1 GTP cyclohydrolase 1 [Vallitalea longa]